MCLLVTNWCSTMACWFMRVESVQGTKVHCRVRVGGILSNNKGINLRGGGLTADVVTEKDKADIITAAKMQADYVAVSFPRSADDIRFVRELLKEAGSNAGIVAKIERAEAIENIEDILDASEAIMIARGDLGVELGDAQSAGRAERPDQSCPRP